MMILLNRWKMCELKRKLTCRWPTYNAMNRLKECYWKLQNMSSKQTVGTIGPRRLPYPAQGMRHREQCAMSKDRAGYGMRFSAMIPRMAGTPLSKANCTWDTCVSRGAKDIVNTSLFSKYAPQLATCKSHTRYYWHIFSWTTGRHHWHIRFNFTRERVRYLAPNCAHYVKCWISLDHILFPLNSSQQPLTWNWPKINEQ